MFANFACATSTMPEVEAKIQEVNREADIIKPGPFRERGVVLDDYKEFGRWLVACKATDITTASIGKKLDQLMHRRWAWYHIQGAPLSEVNQESSMPII
jgi:hypothetical protein